jgi:hypothetical protein
VSAKIIGLLIVSVVTSGCFLAQSTDPHVAIGPRILVNLPDDIPSEATWIRYSLTGRTSTGATVRREPNLRQYVINTTVGGIPAQYAKIVIYAPGCRFRIYNLELDGISDVSKQFECDPLSTKIVHGFLPPAQIPSSIFTAEKTLDVVAELAGDWVCEFFFQPPRGSTIIMGGSCLGSAIPLGTVGEIDPAKGGAFEIAIPDFTRDPVFKGTGEIPRTGNFDVIHLGLRDKKVKRVLGAIKPDDAGTERGLNVQVEYPSPVMFTRVR